MKMSNLQELIDRTEPGGTLMLAPGRQEFAGPVRIDKPLVLQGEGATICAAAGPVVRIGAVRAELRNLNVELTGAAPRGEALTAESGATLALDNVLVRGPVKGVGEADLWRLPVAVSGPAQAGGVLEAPVQVPGPARAEWNIEGIGQGASALSGGAARISIPVPADFTGDTLGRGTIRIVAAAGAARTIPVGVWSSARAAAAPPPLPVEECPVPPPKAAVAPPEQPARGRRLLGPVLAVVLLIAAAGGAFLFLRNRGPGLPPHARLVKALPARFDMGKVSYLRAEGQVSVSFPLKLSCAARAPIPITISRVYTNRLDGYVTRRPPLDLVLEKPLEEIPLSFSARALNGETLDLLGMVSITSSDTNVIVRPAEIPVTMRIEPQ
jgi:hypothetical protein